MTLGAKARIALQAIQDNDPNGLQLLFQLLMRGYTYDVSMRELRKLAEQP